MIQRIILALSFFLNQILKRRKKESSVRKTSRKEKRAATASNKRDRGYNCIISFSRLQRLNQANRNNLTSHGHAVRSSDGGSRHLSRPPYSSCQRQEKPLLFQQGHHHFPQHQGWDCFQYRNTSHPDTQSQRCSIS